MYTKSQKNSPNSLKMKGCETEDNPWKVQPVKDGVTLISDTVEFGSKIIHKI